MRGPALVTRPRAVRTDRCWEVPREPDAVWDLMGRTGRYRDWWPWLGHFDADGGLRAGARWRCTVRPPLPYELSFDLHLHSVRPGEGAAAEVRGDVEGSAQLLLRPAGRGTSVRLVSELRPANPLLRSVATVAPSVAQWGHDWVLSTGMRQFTGRALGDGG